MMLTVLPAENWIYHVYLTNINWDLNHCSLLWVKIISVH